MYDEGEELTPDPVSRLPSPVHKARKMSETVSRLEGVTHTVNKVVPEATMMLCSTETVAPQTPRTPRTARVPQSDTPSPLVPLSRRPGSPLLEALQMLRSTEMIAPHTPQTPRTAKELRTDTPPPLVPSLLLRPPLLQALQMKSVEGVRAALREDPMAANEHLWDHRCDHPLWCAVRLQSSLEIVQLLLDHGADRDAIGM